MYHYLINLTAAMSLIGGVIVGGVAIEGWTNPTQHNVNSRINASPKNSKFTSLTSNDDSNPFLAEAQGLPSAKGSNYFINTSTDNTIYAYNYQFESSTELYVSFNSGVNFQPATVIPQSIIINNIEIIGNVDYICTNKGLYSRQHYSETFKSEAGLPDQTNVNDVFISNNNDIYVGTESSGLWVSSPGEQKFKQVSGLTTNCIKPNAIAETTDGTIYVGTYNHGLWVKDESGQATKFKLDTTLPDDDHKNDRIDVVATYKNMVYAGTGMSPNYPKKNDDPTGNGLWCKETKSSNDFQQAREASSVVRPWAYILCIEQITISTNGTVFFSGDKPTAKQSIDKYKIMRSSEIYCITNPKNFQCKEIDFRGKLTPRGRGAAMFEYAFYIDKNGIVYRGFNMYPALSDSFQDDNHYQGIWYSKDFGENMEYLSTLNGKAPSPSTPGDVTGIKIASNNAIYMYFYNLSSEKYSLYFANISKLFNYQQPDYYANQVDNGYDGWVYKGNQDITIKSDYIKTASLDGTKINLDQAQTLTDLGGEHNDGKYELKVTLKDDYKQYAPLFSGDGDTGVINYNFWIKSKISSNEFAYQAESGHLYSNLNSIEGNTKGKPIIQTTNSGANDSSPLTLTLNDKMINQTASYLVEGTVDDNNNFTPDQSTKKPLATSTTTISNDGIYHLFLIDYLGNTYEAYLELGKTNWKLVGTFNNPVITEKATALNIKLNLSLTSVTAAQENLLLATLMQYQANFDLTETTLMNSNNLGYANSQIESKLKPQHDYLEEQTLTSVTQTIQNKINSDLLTTDIKSAAAGLLTVDINTARKTAGLQNDQKYKAVLAFKGLSEADEPKNKSEVDNFRNSKQSFSDWLKQAKADYDAAAAGGKSTSNSLSTGAIIGIVIAGVVVFLAVIGVGIILIRRHVLAGKNSVIVY